MNDPPPSKTCRNCHETKDLSQFYRDASRSPDCKVCTRKSQRAWRSTPKRKQAAKERARAWDLAHPEEAKKRILRCTSKPEQRYKKLLHGAFRRNKAVTLTLEEYTQVCDLPCFYCQNRLYKPSANSGVDRLDNSKGYEPGNVVSCCYACNTIRGQFLTPEETRVAVEAVLALRGSLSGATPPVPVDPSPVAPSDLTVVRGQVGEASQ